MVGMDTHVFLLEHLDDEVSSSEDVSTLEKLRTVSNHDVVGEQVVLQQIAETARRTYIPGQRQT